MTSLHESASVGLVDTVKGVKSPKNLNMECTTIRYQVKQWACDRGITAENKEKS